MRNIGNFIIALSVLTSTVGCAKTPPKCGDSVAKDTVIDIINEQLENRKKAFVSINIANEKMTYKVTMKNIRTISKDNTTGSYKCEATVDVDSNSSAFKKSHDIIYMTQITEDTHEAYITVQGFKP